MFTQDVFMCSSQMADAVENTSQLGETSRRVAEDSSVSEAMETEVQVKVFCTECKVLGAHTKMTCPYGQYPVSVTVQPTSNRILTATNQFNKTQVNQTSDPGMFQSSTNPPFKHGRALLQWGEHHRWQKFSYALEYSLMYDAIEQPQPEEEIVESPINPKKQTDKNLGQRTSTPTPDEQTDRHDHTDRTGQTNRALFSETSLNDSFMALTTNLSKLAESMTTNVVRQDDRSTDAVTMESLLNATPSFDGNESNWAAWSDKIKLCEPYCSERQLLSHIKAHLGPIPSDFVSSIGSRADTVEGLLLALNEKYNPFSKPLYSESMIARLQQGNKSIEEHHALVTELVRGCKETLATTNKQIKARYIMSLADHKARMKIHYKLYDMSEQEKDKVTLEELMKIASKHAYLTKITYYENKTEQAASAAPATVSVTDQATEVAVAAPAQQQSEETGSNKSNNNSSNGKGNNGQGNKKGKQAQKRNNQGQPKSGGKGNGQKQKQGEEGQNQGDQPTKYCIIHQTTSHDTEECKLRYQTHCYYCDETFAAGHYAVHLHTSCQAPKCYNCGRFGHKSPDCKAPKRARSGRPQQQQGKGKRPEQRSEHGQGQGQARAAPAQQVTFVPQMTPAHMPFQPLQTFQAYQPQLQTIAAPVQLQQAPQPQQPVPMQTSDSNSTDSKVIAAPVLMASSDAQTEQ